MTAEYKNSTMADEIAAIILGERKGIAGREKRR